MLFGAFVEMKIFTCTYLHFVNCFYKLQLSHKVVGEGNNKQYYTYIETCH